MGAGWLQPRIDAGKLRFQVTIQNPATAQDAAGQAYGAQWTNYVTTWASIEPITGREQVVAEQIYGQVDVRIRMRYQPGINDRQQVLYTDGEGVTHNYDVQSVVNVSNRNRELILMCIERTQVGGQAATEA